MTGTNEELVEAFSAAQRRLDLLEASIARMPEAPASTPRVSLECLDGVDDFINDLRRERINPPARQASEPSLLALLNQHDEAFVDAVYLAVLRRLPDPDGRAHFLAGLRSGRLSKTEVVGRLRYSAEGRLTAVSLPGLLPRYGVKLAGRIPVVGAVVRSMVGLVRLPRLVESLQRLESTTFHETRSIRDVNAAHLQKLSEATRAALATLSGQLDQALHDAEHRARGFAEEVASAQAGSAQRQNAQMQEQIEQFRKDATTAGRSLEHAREAIGELQLRQQWVRRFDPPSEAQMRQPSRRVEQSDEVDTDRGLYARFESRFRGKPEDIRERLEEILPLAQNTFLLGAALPGIDLGCGRGEWLQLLGDEGLPVKGIDLDDDFIASCRSAGLSVEKADALTYLQALPAASTPLVTAFHLVEHLSIRDLIELLDQCRRVVVPGGRVLFETPNPENVTVGANYFWYDHTHRTPLAPDLLQFFLEDRGFTDVQVVRLRRNRLDDDLDYVDTSFPYNHQLNSMVRLMKQHLVTEPDYAIVGMVPTPTESAT